MNDTPQEAAARRQSRERHTPYDPSYAGPQPGRQVYSRHVPEAVARWLMQHVETNRVGGKVTCEVCHLTYDEHHEVYPTFHLLCDGTLGKT